MKEEKNISVQCFNMFQDRIITLDIGYALFVVEVHVVLDF